MVRRNWQWSLIVLPLGVTLQFERKTLRGPKVKHRRGTDEEDKRSKHKEISLNCVGDCVVDTKMFT